MRRLSNLLLPLISRHAKQPSSSAMQQLRLLPLISTRNPFWVGFVTNNLVQSRRFIHNTAVNRCIQKQNDSKEEKANHQNNDNIDQSGQQQPDPVSQLPDYVKNHVFLSDLPFHFLPNFWKSIRNRIFEFMIRSYFDREFSITSFISGATQAVVLVSNALADSNFEALESMDVLSPDALAEVRENLAKMTVEQRSFLRISAEDIFRKFIYEIGIIMDDNTDEKFVEIMFIAHGQHGLANLRENLQTSPPTNVSDAASAFANAIRPFGADEFVCNYRFIRQFRSPSVATTTASYWIINKLNHFRPLHYILRHHFEKPPTEN